LHRYPHVLRKFRQLIFNGVIVFLNGAERCDAHDILRRLCGIGGHRLGPLGVIEQQSKHKALTPGHERIESEC